MKTAIFGDIHENIVGLSNALLKCPPVGERVFVGDWFDKFGQPRYQETVYILKKLAEDPSNRFVLGNHELHYGPWCAFNLVCSGFNHERLMYIRQNLPQSVWDKFKFFQWVDENWLISHAGLHPMWLHPIKGFDRDYLEEKEKEIFALLKLGRVSDWIRDESGIVWLRWNKFFPIDGLNQVVGHTQYSNVRENRTKVSLNYNIDTGLRDIALIENNEIHFLKV